MSHNFRTQRNKFKSVIIPNTSRRNYAGPFPDTKQQGDHIREEELKKEEASNKEADANNKDSETQ